MLRPRSSAERQKRPALFDVDLDEAQRGAVTLPPERALLVLGEAGHGKTTVAIHRVAEIWRSTSILRAAMIVPTEGLRRLNQQQLRKLGADVEVLTYDQWASAQARRAFRRLPRESDSSPPSVMRVKRSRALRVALAELASREPGLIDDDRERRPKRTRAHATRGDLQHLFGDRVLLERVVREGKIPDRAIEDVLDRTRIQFSLTTEDENAHVVDRSRLVAVDRRALDEGTATADADTIDPEDYAVLFELDRMRAEKRGASATPPRAFDLVAVDEAQEFAALELALVGRSLAPHATLVVAGDADQQTDATTSFASWDDVMEVLGRPDHERVTLDIGYRCPPDVVAMARAIREGTMPEALDVDLASMGAEMSAVLDDDPDASIAMVFRNPIDAQRTSIRLRAWVPARAVFDGRFLPRGPVQASTVDEVKGLEFDYVIIPDAHAYGTDAASRRALYVAVTRARHQAVVSNLR